MGDLGDPETIWTKAVAPSGLDQPYDPDVEDLEPEESERFRKSWEEWQRYAAERGRRMETGRDVIEFMLELGLLKTHVEEGDVVWTLPDRLPFPEELLQLSSELQDELSEMRWRASFREAATVITSWISEQRIPGATMGEIEVSLQTLAAEVGLDLDDARRGVVTLIADDIRCDQDPEVADSDAVLKLTIGWALFDDWRTAYRSVAPENQ